MELLPIWKAAIFEGLGSMVFIWFIGIASPVFTFNSPIGVAAGLAFLYGSAVALVMFALKPITGAHINPLISLSCMAVGSASVIRGSAYIVAQMIGSMIGGGLVAGALGSSAAGLANGGCVLDDKGSFNPGQAVALEFMAALVLLILAHATGHSSSPSPLMNGPTLAPVLYGLSVGLINFCTSGFVALSGYIGASGFPHVCFGLSMGIAKFQSIHWVFWIPGFMAVIFHGLIYRFLKPYGSQAHSETDESQRTSHQFAFGPSGNPSMLQNPPQTEAEHYRNQNIV